MTEAQRLTHDGIEERRRNLKAFRKELEMEGDETFNTTLQMQEQWLATVDALVAREGELVAALRRLDELKSDWKLGDDVQTVCALEMEEILAPVLRARAQGKKA